MACKPFNPHRWLGRWMKAGGDWHRGDDGRAWFYWPEERLDALRPLWGEIETDQGKRAAIRDAVRGLVLPLPPRNAPAK